MGHLTFKFFSAVIAPVRTLRGLPVEEPSRDSGLKSGLPVPGAPGSLLNGKLAVGLVILCGAASGISFLFSGYPAFGDVWPHLVRVQITYEALRAGHLPSWSFFFYNGYPFLRFYSPLFYYLAAPFCFLTGGNPFPAVKIVLFLLHVASGIALHYLARRVLEDAAAAFVAAFGYLFSYWHLMFVIGFGQYPAGLIFTVIPLTLWLLDRLCERPSVQRAILAGLGIALLPLTHVFYAYFWIPFLIIWFLPLLRRYPARRARQIAWTLASGIIALLLVAFFVLPFFVEGARYRMPLPSLNLKGPSALTMIGLSQEMTGYSGSYIGLGIIILALCGIIKLARERKLLENASFWGLIISVVFAYSGYLPVVNRIPLIGDLPAERFVIFALLFAVLLAGSGYQLLAGGFRVRWLWVPVVALIALDLGPRLYTNVYRSFERVVESRDYVYQKLFGKQDGRFLDAPIEGKDPGRRLTRYPASGYLFAGLPSVFGPPYHQFAPRSMLYAYAWGEDIAREFLDSTREAFSDRALSELRLLDAKYVLTLPTHKSSEQGVTYVFLKRGLTWNDTLLRRVVGKTDQVASDSTVERQPFAIGTFEGLSPIIVASRVVTRVALGGSPARGDSWDVLYTYYVARDWAELPEAMEIDPATGVAQRIISQNLTDSTTAGPELKFTVTSMLQQHEIVELQLSVTGDCYARLAYSYYPELQVLVDDAPVRTWETADHFLLIRLPAGRHSIVVRPTTTRIRRATAGVSAIALMLCIAGLAAGGLVGSLRNRR
jgi:hypothetical protein